MCAVFEEPAVGAACGDAREAVRDAVIRFFVGTGFVLAPGVFVVRVLRQRRPSDHCSRPQRRRSGTLQPSLDVSLVSSPCSFSLVMSDRRPISSSRGARSPVGCCCAPDRDQRPPTRLHVLRRGASNRPSDRRKFVVGGLARGARRTSRRRVARSDEAQAAATHLRAVDHSSAQLRPGRRDRRKRG